MQFDVADIHADVQIVHSLAKWKRMALARYGFRADTGLYTDMNAIRRDEELDNLHSVYVDQWDWERVITAEERTMETLQSAVHAIMGVLHKTQAVLTERFPVLDSYIPEGNHLCLQPGTGRPLPGSDAEAAGRTPPQGIRRGLYLPDRRRIEIRKAARRPRSGLRRLVPERGHHHLVSHPERALELSSMGIRVDAEALRKQLAAAGCEERAQLPFHSMLLEGRLPLTMGGGIGQSRICMALLEKAHIGEVQASVWPDSMRNACEGYGIHLL